MQGADQRSLTPEETGRSPRSLCAALTRTPDFREDGTHTLPQPDVFWTEKDEVPKLSKT